MRKLYHLLACAGLAVVSACGGDGPSEPTPPPTNPPTDTFPITGQAVPGMASFDALIPALMKRWNVPGAAVAVVRDGRLVFARGYGYADVTEKEKVQPDALFRIASISKPITAAAILKLVEEGRLALDDAAFPLRPDLTPPPGATVDPRLNSITIRQLLHHAGGWDRNVSFDPMFRSTTAAQIVGVPAPASAETVVRYMMGQPLDFEPGSRYAYSNFGYAVLGRVIEGITGESYETFVKREILAPAGVTRMRLGRTLLADRAPGEVRYYDTNYAESVFPGGGTVPMAYGGFYLEAMDSHGGWIASTVDLLRFVTAVDGLPTRPDVLSAMSVQQMVAPPPPPLFMDSPWYYAMGWQVRPVEGNWWHTGSLPGTTTLLVRTGSGLAWAILMNSRSSGPMVDDVDQTMWQAVQQVGSWPSHDLFSQFP